MFLGIIIFIAIIFVVIVVHEFGHYITAKQSGLLVKEFSIGFPPRLWSRFKGETKYSIGAIPLGGYVSLEEDEKKERSFPNATKFQRFVILSAGVAFNFILGFIIFIFIFSSGTRVAVTDNADDVVRDATIIKVLDQSAADNAGILIGDTISHISIGGGDDKIENPSSNEFNEFVRSNSEKELEIGYIRDDQLLTSLVTPLEIDIDGEKRKVVGVSLVDTSLVKLSLFEAIDRAYDEVIFIIVQTIKGLIDIFKTGNLDNVAGPVGIAAITGDAVEFGIDKVFVFLAIISISIGVINLFPFPALDGGQLVFLGYETLFRRKVSQKIQSIINFIGFAILIIFIIFVTYSDIQKLISYKDVLTQPYASSNMVLNASVT